MLVNAVTASLICSPSTEIPLPQCFDVLIKHCGGRLVKKGSRALSPPLFLEWHGSVCCRSRGVGGRFMPAAFSSAEKWRGRLFGCSQVHSSIMSKVAWLNNTPLPHIFKILPILPIYLSISLSVCLFVCMSVCLYVSVCVCLFHGLRNIQCDSVYRSFYLCKTQTLRNNTSFPQIM